MQCNECKEIAPPLDKNFTYWECSCVTKERNKKMSNNWMRSNKGKWFNLDKISCFYIDERELFQAPKGYFVCADTWDFDDLKFDTKEEAQSHLDEMLYGLQRSKVWE